MTMTDQVQHLCQESVFRKGGWPRSVACGKLAKHEHNGAWFCGHHRPKADVEADTVLYVVRDQYNKDNPLVITRCECHRTAKQVKVLKTEPAVLYRDVLPVDELERMGFADSPEGAVTLYIAARAKEAARLRGQADKEDSLARVAARLVPAAVADEPEPDQEEGVPA